MKFNWKAVLLSLMLLVSLLPVAGCDPPVNITVENQTDQAIQIYVQGDPYFEVLPHQTNKGKTAIIIYDKFFVEALNTNGEIVYSRTFSHNEFINLEKVVVTPTETSPYLPLEVENRSTYPIEVDVNGAPMVFPLKPGLTIKRRPLPSDVVIYTIEVIASTGGENRVSFETIFKKTFSRDELESMGWKLVVTNPT